MNNTVVIFLIAILVVASMLMAVIMLTRHRGKTLNQQKYQSRWLAIESSLQRDQVASYSLSVLNADKLLDYALRDRGIKGTTMGERLKHAKSLFSNNNHVWAAHKVRNRIAHEPDVKLTYELAARSLQAFKQALKDVGAI